MFPFVPRRSFPALLFFKSILVPARAISFIRFWTWLCRPLLPIAFALSIAHYVRASGLVARRPSPVITSLVIHVAPPIRFFLSVAICASTDSAERAVSRRRHSFFSDVAQDVPASCCLRIFWFSFPFTLT